MSAAYLTTSSFVKRPSWSARSCVASSTTRGTIWSPSGWDAAALTASYQRDAQRHQTQALGAGSCAELAEEACFFRAGKSGQRSLPRPALADSRRGSAADAEELEKRVRAHSWKSQETRG